MSVYKVIDGLLRMHGKPVPQPPPPPPRHMMSFKNPLFEAASQPPPPPPPPRAAASQQHPSLFVLTGPLFTRTRVLKYVKQNLPFWRRDFLDPTLTITFEHMSFDTTFLTITTENDFVITDLISTVLKKLEEAVHWTHSRNKDQGGDLDIMYRYRGIRTDIYMKAGEVTGYSEYVLQQPSEAEHPANYFQQPSSLVC